MHLGHHPACQRPRRRIGRPQPGLRVPLGQRFGHRQRVAYHDAIGIAHDRHQPRGRQIGQVGLHRAVIQPDHVNPAGKAEFLEHQPSPQGPAGKGTIADEKVICHGAEAIPPARHRETSFRGVVHHGQ